MLELFLLYDELLLSLRVEFWLSTLLLDGVLPELLLELLYEPPFVAELVAEGLR